MNKLPGNRPDSRPDSRPDRRPDSGPNTAPTSAPNNARDSRTSALSSVPHVLPACGVAGLLIGQVVAGIASHQPDAALGLVMALVFLLSGAASVLSLAKHLHLQTRGTKLAPMRSWMLALGAGLLASLQLSSLLAA